MLEMVEVYKYCQKLCCCCVEAHSLAVNQKLFGKRANNYDLCTCKIPFGPFHADCKWIRMSAVFLYSVNLSFSGQERTAIKKKKKNIWLSLGFMRTRKVVQFERTGHY